MSHRPVITEKTTLAELQALGATTLSDIPLPELLDYVRNTCLTVAKDTEADKELQWGEVWVDAAGHVQAAIEKLEEVLPR